MFSDHLKEHTSLHSIHAFQCKVKQTWESDQCYHLRLIKVIDSRKSRVGRKRPRTPDPMKTGFFYYLWVWTSKTLSTSQLLVFSLRHSHWLFCSLHYLSSPEHHLSSCLSINFSRQHYASTLAKNNFRTPDLGMNTHQNKKDFRWNDSFQEPQFNKGARSRCTQMTRMPLFRATSTASITLGTMALPPATVIGLPSSTKSLCTQKRKE